MPFPEGSTRSFDELFQQVTQAEYQQIVSALDSFSAGRECRYTTLEELAGDLRVAIALMGERSKDSEEGNSPEVKQKVALLDPYLLDCPAVIPDFLLRHAPKCEEIIAIALRARPALSLQLFDYSFNNSLLAQLSVQTRPKTLLEIECLTPSLELTDTASGNSVGYDLSLPMAEVPDQVRMYLAIIAASMVSKLRQMEQTEDLSAFADL